MSTTSLQHKTVRPGSLVGYSYYHSSRRAPAAARPMPRLFKPSSRLVRRMLIALAIIGILLVTPLLRGGSNPASQSSTTRPPASSPSKPAPAAVPAKTSSNHCAGNPGGKLVIVSISQRHLWACQGSQTAYDTPVVTGIDYLAADLTPTGTFHIYGKQTNLTLTGADSTGSWSDPVQYWMPFLHNQYGSYGFHDATWRAPDAFGSISPNSADASHGCVELPLSAAAWLYDWASVGTTVTIKS